MVKFNLNLLIFLILYLKGTIIEEELYNLRNKNVLV